MAEQDQNRNEAATPFKLEEARKKGSVPRSLDINTWVVLAAGIGTLYLWGPSIANDELALFHHHLSHAHQTSFERADIALFLTHALTESLWLLSPLFLLLLALASLSNFMQTGPVFSFFPLKPDLSRINPVTGLKRLFSIKLLIEAVKTVLKFLLLGTVLYFALDAAVPHLIASMQLHPSATGTFLFPELTSVLFKLLLALAAVAVIDLVYSRWDFARRMRMSRRDITDEHKRREGDPRIKSRLRELQREAVKRARSLGRVKDADVLITNPTHLAVAIQYDRSTVDAPLVIAKGAGFLAGTMRTIARRHRIPIVENKPLARHLFHRVGLDRAVPVEHYGTVARILLWAYSLKKATLRA